jgi:hypothetical protein
VVLGYSGLAEPIDGWIVTGFELVARTWPLRATPQLETITGDDNLIVEISIQYCDNYGSCTDASVVVVDREVYN